MHGGINVGYQKGAGFHTPTDVPASRRGVGLGPGGIA